MNFAKEMDWDKPSYYRSTRVEIGKLLSFLTVETEIPNSDWPGKHNGWTEIRGPGGLIISGAIIDGVEYLNSIQYGKKLHNPYNNYVNPFYLFDILNEEGKKFFIDMYMDDIQKSVDNARKKADLAMNYADSLEKFWLGVGVKFPGR